MQESAREAGFGKIEYKVHTIPASGWPKDSRLKRLGQFAGFYMDLSVDGFVVYPIGQILGWSREEVEVLVAEIRAILRNERNLCSGDL